jgi:oxalate decarboxylase/phosphoglucose isomerase-like protein (cupin superfamily)
MTVFSTGPKATTNDFRPGDVGVVRKSLGHYVENTGSDVLQFVEVFRASKYEEVSLAEWFGHLPPEPVMQHFESDPGGPREASEWSSRDRPALTASAQAPGKRDGTLPDTAESDQSITW